MINTYAKMIAFFASLDTKGDGMLALTRYEGQWVEVKHKSGDVIRIRVYNISGDNARLAFDDEEKNFQIQRPEAIKGPPES